MIQKLMKEVKKMVKTYIFLLKMYKKVKNWGIFINNYEKNKNFTF